MDDLVCEIGEVDRGWLRRSQSINYNGYSDPIVVLGQPRTGTSYIAGLLLNLGVYMGSRFDPPDEYNPRGYFEDKEIVQLAAGRYTGLLTQTEFVAGLRVIFKLRKSMHSRWGFKVPLTFLWPQTVYTLIPSAKVIITHREKEATISSQCKVWKSMRNEDMIRKQYELTEQAISEYVYRCDDKNIMHVEIPEYNQSMVDRLIHHCDLSGIPKKNLVASKLWAEYYQNYTVWPKGADKVLQQGRVAER